jgi:hypothetical protein
MEAELIIPHFATESEEADWLYANRDRLSAAFVKAGAEGRLTHGTAMRRVLAARAMIQLDAADAQRARAAAERQGMTFDAYMKMLVHEALDRQAEAA